jgi:hypothetical protein
MTLLWSQKIVAIIFFTDDIVLNLFAGGNDWYFHVMEVLLVSNVS